MFNSLILDGLLDGNSAMSVSNRLGYRDSWLSERDGSLGIGKWLSYSDLGLSDGITHWLDSLDLSNCLHLSDQWLFDSVLLSNCCN